MRSLVPPHYRERDARTHPFDNLERYLSMLHMASDAMPTAVSRDAVQLAAFLATAEKALKDATSAWRNIRDLRNITDITHGVPEWPWKAIAPERIAYDDPKHWGQGPQPWADVPERDKRLYSNSEAVYREAWKQSGWCEWQQKLAARPVFTDPDPGRAFTDVAGQYRGLVAVLKQYV